MSKNLVFAIAKILNSEGSDDKILQKQK